MFKFIYTSLLAAVLAVPVMADAPATAADISPTKIKIVSGVMEDEFIKLIVQQYALQNPDCKINITACSGTTEALKCLDAGAADLVVVQLQKDTRKPVFGVLKPYAVITNPSSPLENISQARLAKAFTGEIASWSDLGGMKAPIKIITFPAGSGAAVTLSQLLGITDITARNQLAENGERAVVALTAANPGSLGCVPVEYVNADVKILKIDGVMPDQGSIAAGKYPLVARFLVLQSPKASADTAQLVKFMRSSAGEEICRYLSLRRLKVE